MVPMWNNWLPPATPDTRPPGAVPPALSRQIDTMRKAIPSLQRRVLDQAGQIDLTGRWTASMVASGALQRAEQELAIAALSLGIQEDLET